MKDKVRHYLDGMALLVEEYVIYEGFNLATLLYIEKEALVC